MFPPAEKPRDLRTHKRWTLRRGNDRDTAIVVVGYRRERLECKVQHLLRPEGVFKDVRGRDKRLIDIAAPEPEIERDIGTLAPLEVLQIGKGAGRLQLVVYDNLVFGSLHLVIHSRQLFVFGNDLLHGLLRDVRIVRQYDSYRLTYEMHFADGEDRLVVKCRAIVGVWNNAQDVLAGIDRTYTRNLSCGSGIHSQNAAMRHSASEDLRVQHSRHLHHVRVFGAARHFIAPFNARYRAVYLLGGNVCLSHTRGAPLRSIAARTARRT